MFCRFSSCTTCECSALLWMSCLDTALPGKVQPCAKKLLGQCGQLSIVAWLCDILHSVICSDFGES